MLVNTRRWGILSWTICCGLSFLCLTSGCGQPTAAESAASTEATPPAKPTIVSKPVPHNPVNQVAADLPPVVAPKPVDRRTVKSNHPPQNEMLRRLAARLHTEALAHFYSDPTNGYSRMPIVYERIVRKWKSPEFSPGELGSDEPIAFETDLRRIHRSSLTDFSTPKVLAQKSPRPRYGRTANTHGKKFDRSRKVWEVNRLDLVGLVMHSEPVAYVSEKLPEMNKLHAVPTRELDDFESSGLSVLRSGKELYGRSGQATIRLLGALRASKNCLACHKANKTGDLLGAFSYTLREAKYERRVQRLVPLRRLKSSK